jgi:pimeloyl-ACP methyl ester carboxylesterase
MGIVWATGSRFVVDILGTGSPPVVLVSALGEDQSEWDSVHAELQVPTTEVTYGRPGLGGSDGLSPDLSAVPRSFGWAADQLHDLLDAAGVASPRVLVGHSIGGLIVERYAAHVPDDVAGLVLVDTTDPRLMLGKARDERLMLDGDEGDGGVLFDFASSWNEFGDSPSQPGPLAVVVASAPGRWSRCQEPERYAPFTMREIDEAWQDFQRQLARRTHARLVVAHFAGHRLDSEAPGLVACAIDTVVTAVRERTELRFDVERLYASGGRLVQFGPTLGEPGAAQLPATSVRTAQARDENEAAPQ